LDEEEMNEYDAEMRELYGLEYLKLDEDARPSVVDDSTKQTIKRSHIASLRDFEVLRKLSIRTAVIIPPFENTSLIDLLPDSLEYLCFYGYRRGVHQPIDSAINELLDNASVKLPNLKEIKGVEETIP
jgi:hypothetical protein